MHSKNHDVKLVPERVQTKEIPYFQFRHFCLDLDSSQALIGRDVHGEAAAKSAGNAMFYLPFCFAFL